MICGPLQLTSFSQLSSQTSSSLQACMILLSVTYNLHSHVYARKGFRGLIRDAGQNYCQVLEGVVLNWQPLVLLKLSLKLAHKDWASQEATRLKCMGAYMLHLTQKSQLARCDNKYIFCLFSLLSNIAMGMMVYYRFISICWWPECRDSKIFVLKTIIIKMHEKTGQPLQKRLASKSSQSLCSEAWWLKLPSLTIAVMKWCGKLVLNPGFQHWAVSNHENILLAKLKPICYYGLQASSSSDPGHAPKVQDAYSGDSQPQARLADDLWSLLGPVWAVVKTTEYRSVLYIIKLDLSRYYNIYIYIYICIRSRVFQLLVWHS